jgi:hypothetical protein
MARLQSEDWETILTAIAVQTDTAVGDGTLNLRKLFLVSRHLSDSSS